MRADDDLTQGWSTQVDQLSRAAVSSGTLSSMSVDDSVNTDRRRADVSYPHDIAAEQALLGAVLLDEARLDEIVGRVSPADLYRTAHRHILATMLDLRARGSAVDPLTIDAAMTKRQRDDVGGRAYIASLTDGLPAAANVADYAEIVRVCAVAREQLRLLDRTAAQLRQHPTEAVNGLPAAHADAWSRLTIGDLSANRDTPVLRTDVEIMTMPEPTFLVSRILPTSVLACLYGEPGIGKTFLALDLTFCVGSGRPWFGAAIEQPGPAIYVVSEGAAAMRERVSAWKIAREVGLDDPAGVLFWDGAVPLLDSAAVARFIAATKPHAPRLVVLDTYARCLVGGDENSARDTGLAVAAADRIRTALGATVLLVHHLAKSGAAERGSTALRGACDTMLSLAKTDDILRVECSKQKDAEPFQPFELRLVPAYPGARSCVLRPAHEVRSDDLTDSQSKLMHVMRELFAETGATSAELEQALPGMHRATFFRARGVLVDKGLIAERAKRWHLRGTVARSRTAVARECDSQSHEVAP